MLFAVAHPYVVGAQRTKYAALDSLASETTRLTARYADRRIAAAEGYRRLGADFPSMGEHWLNTAALLDGRLDASRPTLLLYATIAGKPTLLGVGFVTTTRGDSSIPGVAGWPVAWHEHSGLLADESGVAPGKGSPTDTHVWVVHAWTSLRNPAGAFAPDNWLLPFARAQLPLPPVPDPLASLAVALATTGDVYLRGVLTDAGARTSLNAPAVDAAIASARARVLSLVSGARAKEALSSEDLSALRAEWLALAAALHALIGPSVERYLMPAHDTMTGEDPP